MSESLCEYIVKNNDYKIIDIIFNEKINYNYDSVIKMLLKNMCKISNTKFIIYIFDKIIKHDLIDEKLLYKLLEIYIFYNKDVIYHIFKVLINKNLYINKLCFRLRHIYVIELRIIKLIFNKVTDISHIIEILYDRHQNNILKYILKFHSKRLNNYETINIFMHSDDHHILVYILLHYKFTYTEYVMCINHAIEINDLKLIKLLKNYHDINTPVYIKCCKKSINDNITKYFVVIHDNDKYAIIDMFIELCTNNRISMIIWLLKSKYYDIIKGITVTIELSCFKKIADIKFIISLNRPNFILRFKNLYHMENYNLLSEIAQLQI